MVNETKVMNASNFITCICRSSLKAILWHNLINCFLSKHANIELDFFHFAEMILKTKFRCYLGIEVLSFSANILIGYIFLFDVMQLQGSLLSCILFLFSNY